MYVRSAASASPTVATFAMDSPGTALRTASAQLPSGTRKSCAPAALAPTSLCGMPPIRPTAPASSMLPVPAIIRPPVRRVYATLSMVPAATPPVRPANAAAVSTPVPPTARVSIEVPGPRRPPPLAPEVRGDRLLLRLER